jgi:SH3-like domain-containing protein
VRTVFRSLILFSFICLAQNQAWALCVIHNGVSLRAGAGTKHAVTWIVPKYTPLIDLKRVGGWYQVEDMDGETHWVSSKNVSSKMVCVSVKVANVKLRLTPNPQGDLAPLRQVDRYTSFKRLDVRDTWYEVEASWGESYWVPETAVWRPLKISKVNF